MLNFGKDPMMNVAYISGVKQFVCCLFVLSVFGVTLLAESASAKDALKKRDNFKNNYVVPSSGNASLPAIMEDLEFSIAENSDAEILVGKARITGNQNNLFWKIINRIDIDKDGHEAFRIDSITGNIYVNDLDDLDFEYKSCMSLKLSIGNENKVYDKKKLKIFLQDENDTAPAILQYQWFVVDELPQSNSSIGHIKFFDPDLEQAKSNDWAIVNNPDPNGNDVPAFRIDQQSGELFVNDPADFDLKLNNCLKFDLAVSDGKFQSETEEVTVSLKCNNKCGQCKITDTSICSDPRTGCLKLIIDQRSYVKIYNQDGDILYEGEVNEGMAKIQLIDFNANVYHFIELRQDEKKITQRIFAASNQMNKSF